MLSQSAAAFERVAGECSTCHKQIVVDKVAKVALKVTGADGFKWERQTVSAVMTANEGYRKEKAYPSIVIADYRTGFKSRPGWQA